MSLVIAITRKVADVARFESAFKEVDGKRLTYAKLISQL
jgi:hypothetical protein